MYIIYLILAFLPLTLLFPTIVVGRKNLKKGKCIITANHRSNMDAIIVYHKFGRKLHFLAKKELFENIFLRWWLNWLGAFAVDREKLGVSTIKTVMTIKKTGWVLGIFPQGTRQEPGEISNVTKGFASLAKSTKCGILPVGITGTQEVKRFPFTGKIIVKIGKLIPYSDDSSAMVDEWGNSIQDLTGFKYNKEHAKV